MCNSAKTSLSKSHCCTSQKACLWGTSRLKRAALAFPSSTAFRVCLGRDAVSSKGSGIAGIAGTGFFQPKHLANVLATIGDCPTTSSNHQRTPHRESRPPLGTPDIPS